MAQDHQRECSFKGVSRSCQASYDLALEILEFLFYYILLVKEVTQIRRIRLHLLINFFLYSSKKKKKKREKEKERNPLYSTT